MTRNEAVTSILYRLYANELIPAVYNSPDELAINEALQMGLIHCPGNIYFLTKEGLLLVKAGKTYDDLLSDLQPINIPNAKPSTEFKDVPTRPISNIFKNDYVKYTVIGVIVTIISYFAYEYFKYNKW